MNDETLAQPFRANSYVNAMYKDMDRLVRELTTPNRAIRRFADYAHTEQLL